MKSINDKNTFRHESLQDSESIKKLLSGLLEGLEQGELYFTDEDGEIAMTPAGLLHLKVTASKEDGRNRVNLRITWQDELKSIARKKTFKIETKKSEKVNSTEKKKKK